MAKTHLNKINIDQIANATDLNPEIEEKRLIAEIGKVIIAAKEKPKSEAFSFALSQIPDPLLNQMLESVGDRHNDDNPAASPILLLAGFLRQHLHGDNRGGFKATEDDFFNIINSIVPYITIELVRRRGCFGFLELPESPWAFNAAVRIREPNREAIERTIEEFKDLQVPLFPLLTSEKDLQRMEKEDVGVVIEMGVRGRSVATEEMLHIQPHKAPPLDPKTFMDAFRKVNERAFSTEPISFPKLPPSMSPEVDLIDKKGSTRRINIPEMQNSPEGRMIAVLHEFFGHDQEEDRSALLRFYALMKLLRDGTISKWTEEKPEGSTLHPAILVTAATLKLTKGGGFPPVKFQQEVQRLITEAAKG